MPKKTYVQLQAELDEILDQLQSPDLDIDKAADLYKTGQDVVKKLEQHLTSVKNQIEQIK